VPGTLLDRPSFASSFQALELSPLQSQVDGLVGGFVHQATDWHSLAAMTAGGAAYRLGRIGMMSTGLRGGKVLSIAAGFGAEITTYEMTNRALQMIETNGRSSLNPNLWRWDGQGGIRQGLLNSLITFGTLKGAGRMASGENVLVQHLLQDTAMVLGHQVSAVFNITSRPTGTLAEQFLHAEATNLQLSAGMAFAHAVAPGVQGLERGLDLFLRLADVLSGQAHLPIGPQPALAVASSSGGPINLERPSEPVGHPHILAMDGTDGSGTDAPPLSGREKEFWFPHRSGPRGLLSLKYSPPMNRVLDELMEQIRRNTSDGTSRPDERLLSLNWIYQIVDLGKKLNAKINLCEDSECLLKPLKSQQASHSGEVLSQAVRLLREDNAGPESEWVLEMTIPFEEVSFGRKENNKFTELVYILETIEGNLLNTVHLAESVKGQGFMKVRFPTPPLLERLLKVTRGNDAPRFHYVEGEVPRDEAMALKVEGAIAIGYSRKPLLLRDLGVKVPAVVFTLHDLFHAASITNFSPSFRQYAGWLYNRVLSSGLRRYPYTREHLNRLVDLDPPLSSSRRLESFFGHIFGHLADHYRQDFQADDDIQFKAILKYRNFLEDYLRLLEANRPADPQWAEWQCQLADKVRPLFRSVQDLLQEIVRIYTPFVFPKQK
jgi:hypothetical protein